MKTKKIFFYSAVVLGAVLFASCSKDSTPDLTTTEAQTEVSTALATYDADIATMDNAQGIAVYNQINSLNLPFSLPTEDGFSSTNYVMSFSSRLLAVKIKDFSSMRKAFRFSDNFDFQSNIGVWEYNAQTQEFDQTSTTPSDKVIIKFPYPTTNTTNNAVFTISKYTISMDMDDFGGTYQANLTLDGNEIWAINYTSSLSTNSSSSTISQTVTLKFSPHEYTETSKFVYSGSESAYSFSGNLSRTLKKNSKVLLAGSYDISFKATDRNMSYSIKGNLTVSTIRFHIEMASSSDESEYLDVNNLIQITVYSTSGAKMGEMKYVTNQDQVSVLMFYYNDGTSVEASTLFGSILGEFNDFLNSAQGQFFSK